MSGSGVSADRLGTPSRPAWKTVNRRRLRCSGSGEPIATSRVAGVMPWRTIARRLTAMPRRHVGAVVGDHAAQPGRPRRGEQRVLAEIGFGGRGSREVRLDAGAAQTGVRDDVVEALD